MKNAIIQWSAKIDFKVGLKKSKVNAWEVDAIEILNYSKKIIHLLIISLQLENPK